MGTLILEFFFGLLDACIEGAWRLCGKEPPSPLSRKPQSVKEIIAYCGTLLLVLVLIVYWLTP